MNDRTTEFDADRVEVAEKSDGNATIDLANSGDTNVPPRPAATNTVSLPATPSAMFDLSQLENGMETITYPRTFGPYELLEEIARGGMGIVFKARQKGLDRVVALKMILGIQNQGTNIQRFLEEARAVAALDHPNVVPIFDINTVDGKMYFTMPFVNGPSLKALVERTGTPPVQKTIGLFLQIALGVAEAHRKGIVHRDLKPANVLVDSDGRPRVADFGLAKRAGDSDRMNMTGTGQLMGTPAYMSPEQARDSKDVTPATDVYSLGSILYFLLTGHAPFVCESVPDLLIKVVSEMPRPPHAENPAIPEDVSLFSMKCLAKAPEDRYPDAVALADAFAVLAERYLSRSSVHAQYNSNLADSLSLKSTGTIPVAYADVPDDSPAEAKRSRVPWPGIALALALIAGGTATALYCWPWRKATPPVAAGLGVQTDAGTPAQPVGTGPAVAIADNGAKPVVADKTWPEPQADFKLGLELRARAKIEEMGVVLLPNRTRLELQLRPEADCWVYVFVVDPNESAVLLFPNTRETDSFLFGGVTRVIPSDPKYALETETTLGEGVERIRVIASTEKLSDLPPGQAVGNFRQFENEVQKKELSRTVRNLRTIRPVDVNADPKKKMRFAEAEIQFRVK